MSIEAILIYGSADKGKIDESLISMHEYLQRRLPITFGTLQTFESKHFELSLGELGDLPLPTGSVVRFLPIAIVNGRLHLHLEMPGLNTRLQVQSGRPMILGGPRYENGLMFVELISSFGSLDAAPDELPGDGNQPPARRRPPGPPPSRVVQQPAPRPPAPPEVPLQRVGTER